MQTTPAPDIIDMTGSLNGKLGPNKPKYIVIHSTRSYPEFPELLALHRKRGFAGVGYHFFVSNSNKVYQARPIFSEGAHAYGLNAKSVGLCIYSKDGKLDRQKIDHGRRMISFIKSKAVDLEVISHTLAQVMYINDLMAKEGMDKRFAADNGIVNEGRFDAARTEFARFAVGRPDGELGERLREFKNCPGPLFNDLLF